MTRLSAGPTQQGAENDLEQMITFTDRNAAALRNGQVRLLLICFVFPLPLCACMLSCFSCVRLYVTPWTVAHQAPLSMGFSRQEYLSGLPCPPPGDLPDPRIKPVSPTLAGGFFTASATWAAHNTHHHLILEHHHCPQDKVQTH